MRFFLIIFGCILSSYDVNTFEFTIGALLSDSKVLSSFEKIVSSISDNVYDEVVSFKAVGEVIYFVFYFNSYYHQMLLKLLIKFVICLV